MTRTSAQTVSGYGGATVKRIVCGARADQSECRGFPRPSATPELDSGIPSVHRGLGSRKHFANGRPQKGKQTKTL